jgi:hypothetical protein
MPRLLICCFSVLLLSHPVLAAGPVPVYLLRLPASISTVFVADTATAEFYRFDNTPGELPDFHRKSYMSIGQNGDGKRHNGDRRTPLGIYFVTDQIDTERLHEKYGVTAFPLDYPNAWDQRLGRSGNGIWVHGVDRRGGKRPVLDTDGCIALPNNKLSEWERSFRPGLTPVIIAREIRWAEPRQLDALRKELESAVATWADTLERGDAAAHLALYADDFRHMGLNADEWGVLQRETLAERGIQEVDFHELLLLADPVEEDLYLSRFQLATAERSGTVTFLKRIYWRRTATGELKIIAEDAG